MYKLQNYILAFITLVMSILFLTGIISCQSNTCDLDNPNSPESTYPLRVNAQMSEVSSTRAYQAEGQIVSGQYYMSYPNASSKYTLAIVDFDNVNVSEGIGIVTDYNSEQELTWQNVGGNQPTFYIDNVGIQENAADPMIVTFDNSYNPFVGGIFDKNGENDLLWGYLTTNRNTQSLDFDLHHNMARLVVEITTDETNSQTGALSLDDATVEITSLILSPASYNRQDGTLYFKENPEYKTLTLVAPADDTGQDNSIPWGKSESEGMVTTYTTQDFVLPPQGLLEDTERPRLKITLSNGNVYSGVVPYAMTVVNSVYPEGYPMTLSFLKEHILTLRTLITENPPELVFMPVQVVEWVDKGEFFMDGHQAGIYSASEFSNMLKALREGNEYQLTRYGSKNEEGWTFVLWNYINLQYDSIFKGYTGSIAFRFQFNGYGVNVIYGETSKPVNTEQLHDIVKGNLIWGNIPSTP